MWEAVAHPLSNTAHYDQGHGEELYRRSLYTFWKRTAPPPAMQILDAPSRETCRVRRSRTNTPSAALLMMNDIPFIEAARKLAENLQQPRELNDAQRLANMFRRLTAHDPDPVERTELKRVLQQFRQQYATDPAAAKQLLRVGESPVSFAITTDDQELAAWTMVASLLLNLDETITK